MRTLTALTSLEVVVGAVAAGVAVAKGQRVAVVAKVAVVLQRAPRCVMCWASDSPQLCRAQSGRKLWREPTSVVAAVAEGHFLPCARARARASMRAARCHGFGGALRQHKLPLSGS